MAKRFTDTDKYKKRFIRSLPAAYKILWDYLYHDCNHAGIWHVDFDIAQIYVGKDAPIDKDEALKRFNDGEERIIVLNGGSKWLIKTFLSFQYGELKPDNRVHSSILSILEKEGIKGLASPLQGAKDKEKDKDKDKDKEKEKEKEKKVTVKTVTPQAAFIESFSGIYEQMTGHKFKADKKHYKIVYDLINKYGYEQIVEKATLLAGYCSKAEVWFAKEGWSCFTPETLSTHWNRIIPIMSEEDKKEKKRQEEREKWEKHEREINAILENSTN